MDLLDRLEIMLWVDNDRVQVDIPSTIVIIYIDRTKITEEESAVGQQVYS